MQLSRVMLLLAVVRFRSSPEPLVFGKEETVDRCWGRNIAAKTTTTGFRHQTHAKLPRYREVASVLAVSHTGETNVQFCITVRVLEPDGLRN